MKKFLYSFFLLFFIFTGFAQEENHPLFFGNPSGAAKDISFETNYLLEKSQYILSYNNETLCPNWVAWHLSSQDLGDASRGNKFKPDQELPEQWYKVTAQDYQFSAYGFDRGHVCPSADRTATQEDNDITFLMTNMIPQSPDCNRIVWMHLENYERELVNAGNEVYIFAGPAGVGGEGNRGAFEEIPVLRKNDDSAALKIRVPQWSWKILLVLPEGEKDMQRVLEGKAEIIAACIPNIQGCQYSPKGEKVDWDYYKCSIDYIEELTGYDFLSDLPVELQKILEQ